MPKKAYTIKIDEATLSKAKQIAQEETRSLNNYIERAIVEKNIKHESKTDQSNLTSNP
jgi:predicted transcriptional regulator